MSGTGTPNAIALDPSSLGALCAVPGEGQDFLRMLGVDAATLVGGAAPPVKLEEQEHGAPVGAVTAIAERVREAIGSARGRLDLHTGSGAPAVVFVGAHVVVLADIGRGAVTWSILDPGAAAENLMNAVRRLNGDELVVRAWSAGELRAEVVFREPEVRITCLDDSDRDRLLQAVDPGALFSHLLIIASVPAG